MARTRFLLAAGALWALAGVPSSAQELVERLRFETQTGTWNFDVSADGRTAAVAHTLPAEIRDLRTGAVTATLKGGYTPDAVAISRDGTRCATGTGGDNLIRIWDVAGARELHVLRGHRAQVRALAFSGDGRTLASGDDAGVVMTWDVATGQPGKTFKGHDKQVNRVAFSPKGRYFASASDDGSVRVWSLVLGTLSVLLDTGAENVLLDFSPDGKQLVVDDAEAVAALWDDDGKKIRTFGGSGDKAAFAAAFLPDGATVVTGDEEGMLRLWDVATGRAKGSVKAHEEAVQDVRAVPSGAIVSAARLEFAVWSAGGAAAATAAAVPALPSLPPLSGAKEVRGMDTVRLRQVVREFEEAARAGDLGRLRPLAAVKAASDAELRSWVAAQLAAAPDRLISAGGPARIAGDAAEVEVTSFHEGERRTGRVRLRREGKDWKVERLWIPVP